MSNRNCSNCLYMDSEARQCFFRESEFYLETIYDPKTTRCDKHRYWWLEGSI
nr:MAG TPA: hypothetical protein [Caudoviricetes sp.]